EDAAANEAGEGMRLDDAGASAAADAACRSDVLPDPMSAPRGACMFHAGAKVSDTIGDVSGLRAAITHVVVITQENHSIDAMFGKTGHGVEGFAATYSNLDVNGQAVVPQHLTTACPLDPAHDRAACLSDWNGGK